MNFITMRSDWFVIVEVKIYREVKQNYQKKEIYYLSSKNCPVSATLFPVIQNYKSFLSLSFRILRLHMIIIILLLKSFVIPYFHLI